MKTDTLLLFVIVAAGLHLSKALDGKQGPSPPTSLAVTSVRYNNISISWKHKGPVDYYTLTVNSDSWNYTSQSNDETITKYFTVIPPRFYSIHVHAVLNGLSSPNVSNTFFARLSVPKIESIIEETTGIVTIRWTQEGPFTDFVISIKTADNRVSKSIGVDASPPTSGSYKGSYSVTVRPGYMYNVSIIAYSGKTPSESSKTQTFIAAGVKQAEKSTPRISIQCYVCNASDCGIARTSTDVKQDCPMNHACWMHRQVDRIIRSCEAKACFSEFHTWKHMIKGSKLTYSKCCIGDVCNAEFVEDSSGLAMAGFPLMISCLFVVLISLFVMA